MISNAELKAKVTELFGDKVMTMSPLSSAEHAESFKIVLEDGERYVAKRSPHSLDEEAKMITYLHDQGGLPTPKIFHASPTLLIMETIHSDWQMNEAAQMDAAAHLARLHQVESNLYGFEFDTHIANILQSNAQNDNWAEFFVQNRLLHMAELAYRKSAIDTDLMKKIDILASKAAGIIGQGNRPVLIHGDCWGGNILPYQGQIKAFIDPAIYYADHEMELAFLTLFNTADQHFFTRYSEEIEIKPGFFEERRILYNIYPLLVHAVLFGRSYARKVNRVVEKFI